MSRDDVAPMRILALFLLVVAGSAFAQTSTQHATGTFEVKMSPQAETAPPDGFARFHGDKTFKGELEATSVVWMLSSMTEKKGSGAYVALEKVTGKLKGRSGTFALQHSGTMQGGNYELNVTVVPDSGTGDLKGLTGKMKIIIEGGKHSYDFEYQLPAQ